jgi:hypothetical protein
MSTLLQCICLAICLLTISGCATKSAVGISSKIKPSEMVQAGITDSDVLKISEGLARNYKATRLSDFVSHMPPPGFQSGLGGDFPSPFEAGTTPRPTVSNVGETNSLRSEPPSRGNAESSSPLEPRPTLDIPKSEPRRLAEEPLRPQPSATVPTAPSSPRARAELSEERPVNLTEPKVQKVAEPAKEALTSVTVGGQLTLDELATRLEKIRESAHVSGNQEAQRAQIDLTARLRLAKLGLQIDLGRAQRHLEELEKLLLK